MDLVKKYLKLAVSDKEGERTLLLDRENALVTFGTSGKATVRVQGAAVPNIAKLIEKREDAVDLYIDEPLQGFVEIGRDKLTFNDLVESGVIFKKNKRPCIELLTHYTGFVEIGDAKVVFGFEDAIFKHEGIPTKFLHPLSPKRLKQFKGPFAKSFFGSALFHLFLILAIFLLPRPHELDRIIKKYIAVKTTLKPIIVKDLKKEPAEVKKIKTSAEGASLLAMIDSKKRLKGFVRNLYFSKADTIEIGRGETQTSAPGTGGLFTRIGKTELKREEIGEVKPLFASAAASRLSKEGGVSFVESSLKTETPEIDGTLNIETISKTVSSGEGALRYCYEEALIRRPDIKGRIVVIIKVTKEGGVENADIGSSSLNDRPFEQCILRKVRAWRFPKAEGSATIKYPFVFVTTKG